jgi:type IV secretion system protein VirB9
MDPRRFLILVSAAALAAGCGTLREISLPSSASAPAAPITASTPVGAETPAPVTKAGYGVMVPIPNPPERTRPRLAAARHAERASLVNGDTVTRVRRPVAAGPAAIAAANAQARARSRSDAFVGGVQVFAWEPSRVYEVWTAPLRVTTLTLAPGETLVSKAAGDTVRWQIGETASGNGSQRRAHVLIKPLERGLETNLVLATSQRLYLVQLKSGAPEAANTAVAWDVLSTFGPALGSAAVGAPDPEPLVTPAGPVQNGFRIQVRGDASRWTPTSVATDGRRTFLRFPPELESGEAPALFAKDADGRLETLNYRQQNGLWVVDRVLDQAELRLGTRRTPVVRITRLQP